MTLEELNSLRFNMPIMSTIDNSLWYYDCRDYTGNAFKIFKRLDDSVNESVWRGRSYYRTGDLPWKREGELTITENMMLEDFELVYKIVNPEINFIKKGNLKHPYSIVGPNFHMMDVKLD